MARLIFPDEGSRLAYRMTGAGKPLLSAATGTVTIYADAAGVVLADIQLTTGEAVPTSTLTVTDASQLPLFLGPDGADTVWASVDGGPLAPVYARSDDRLDALVTGLAGVQAVKTVNGNFPDGSGNVTVAAGAVADAAAGVKGILQLTGDLGGTAALPTTPTAVHVSGAETVNGVKTFNDKPIVPDATFAIAKTTGLQAALDDKVGLLVTLNTQTGTAYTAALADAGALVQMSNASANTFTIPTNATAAFGIGTVIGVAQLAAGLTTITPATGVTLTWNNGTVGTGPRALAGQYAEVSLVKVATDSWRMSGALAP